MTGFDQYASLRQYPPDRPSRPGAICSPCKATERHRPARWLVLGSDDRGTFAEYVCGEHLSEIQGHQDGAR